MNKFILTCALLFINILFVLQVHAGSSHRREGGVSGGGGNVISPTPPDAFNHPDHVEKVVKSSVDDVKTYFFEAERDFRNGLAHEDLKYKPIYEGLFASEVKIHDLIKESFPEIEEDRPCYDLDRNPVDASFTNGHDQEVCVSAYNLARKVKRNEIKAQSIGLMVHEYVELAGLSEEEAVILQKKALQDFKK